MDVALNNNDLVHVVELLARDPKIANKALCNGMGEQPLERARRLQCDLAIIRLLESAAALQDYADSIDFENIGVSDDEVSTPLDCVSDDEVSTELLDTSDGEVGTSSDEESDSGANFAERIKTLFAALH